MINSGDLNVDLWDKLTKIHSQSDFYDIESFKNGKNTLKSIEEEELGDISGKNILHLQCHFGLDTLSLARKGAIVTGMDYSRESIKLAEELATELDISAEFICANIYDLPLVLNKKYDIVFTSYGVLHWLPDLKKWAQVISHFLKPGGFFYIAEMHPIFNMFDINGKERVFPYFHTDEPVKIQKGSCISPETDFSCVSYEWAHSIGDIINSILSAGLRLEYLHEYPYIVFNRLPYLREDSPGKYVIKDINYSIPLMFSLKAVL
jgi:SAM-dependent methyltransferase